MTLREMLMRKINGVPVEAHTDLSNLTGGEVLKWDSTNTLMAWEDQDSTGYVPIVWYGDRGVFTGGAALNGTIDYISISTPGNATDFGDMSTNRYTGDSCSNGSRGVNAGGSDSPWNNVNTMDYITFASPSNATDFGDLSVARNFNGACSDGTYGVWAGGDNLSSKNTIDYVTISVTGNATDFGNLTNSRNTVGGLADATRGVFAGANPAGDVIDYITVATTGNATDFGNLTHAKNGVSGCSSTTRGLFNGYPQGSNNDVGVDYITIQTTGNATDFGDLTNDFSCSSTSDTVTAVFAGSNTGDNTIISKVTIATTSNGTDFGDLTVGRTRNSGMSGD